MTRKELIPFCSLLLVALVFGLLPSVSSTKWNIGFVSVPMRGHISPLLPIAEQLINRGHRVTFFVPKNTHTWIEEEVGKTSNLKLVTVPEGKMNASTMHQLFEEYCGAVTTFDHPFQAATGFANYRLFTEFFSQENVELFHGVDRYYNNTPKNERPHLLVIDPFTTSGFDIARKYDTDWVIYHPGLIFLLDHFVGANQPWIARSNSGYPQKMSLFQRIFNPFVHHALVAALIPSIITMDANRAALPGVVVPSHPFEDFSNKLILCGSTFPLQIPRELPPTVQMVGPSKPKLSGKQLPKAMQDFLKDKSDVIVISFGTIATLSQTQITHLFEAIRGRDVIWTMRKAIRERSHLTDNDHLMMVDWIPQFDLLNNDKVKGFISHCGANSVHEAMFAGVPTICIPFFADQFDFAQRVDEIGSGIYVNKFTFTAQTIAEALDRITTDPLFKSRAVKTGHILRAAEGEVKAADLIEYKLKYGIDHWISATTKQPWYSSFFLDLSYSIFSLLLLAIVYLILKSLAFICCRSGSSTHKKQE